MMTTRPVVAVTSQATWAAGSQARISSNMASAIWSQSLSGWPSVTDSEVTSMDGALIRVIFMGGSSWEVGSWTSEVGSSPVLHQLVHLSTDDAVALRQPTCVILPDVAKLLGDSEM